MLSPDTPILLLTTGGTIDKVYFDALSDYQVGETVMAKLLDVARVKRPFRIEAVSLENTLTRWIADKLYGIETRASDKKYIFRIFTKLDDTLPAFLRGNKMQMRKFSGRMTQDLVNCTATLTPLDVSNRNIHVHPDDCCGQMSAEVKAAEYNVRLHFLHRIGKFQNVCSQNP